MIICPSCGGELRACYHLAVKTKLDRDLYPVVVGHELTRVNIFACEACIYGLDLRYRGLAAWRTDLK